MQCKYATILTFTKLHLLQYAFFELLSDEVDVTVGWFGRASSGMRTQRLVRRLLFRSQTFPLSVPTFEVTTELVDKTRRRTS